ncbi:MAG: S53 family peptidase [Steroidobacteraceae bacterium]
MRSRFRSGVSLRGRLSRSLSASLIGLAGLAMLEGAPADAQNSRARGSESVAPAGDAVPSFLGESRDLGPADPRSTMTISLRLKSSASLDAILQRLYDPSSPEYRQWLSEAQLDAALAAAPRDVATIRQFLASHHLSVLSEARGEILAQGTAADVEAAFRTPLHLFDVHGQIVRANTAAPSISGSAGALVSTVGGLTDQRMSPHWRMGREPDGTAFAPMAVNAVENGRFFSAQCFRPPEQATFKSSGVIATYFGNRYGQDIDGSGAIEPCGYQPSDAWSAYGLAPLYAHGLDGTGETIAIVEAFGSTTIERDVAAFSAVYGLPPADLTMVGTPTAAVYSTDSDQQGWAIETTLDVEWAHAIAPGAKVLLIVAPDDKQIHLSQAVVNAATRPGVVVISSSYGFPESREDHAEFKGFERANKIAAALGISVDYSTGDSGDLIAALGYSDVSYPASSPWATAIGGVSVGVRADGSISMQTGWGANVTRIAEAAPASSPPANVPTAPPLHQGFYAGAGGGPSGVFSKPVFQRGLPGRMRETPDIAWIADPYTGVEIIYTADASGQQDATVIGGTSVACPMFSGLWAIASQRAVNKLGQAAWTLYRLSSRAITDVLPVFSPTNPSGVIQTSSRRGMMIETPQALAAPLDGNHQFFSALFNSPISTRWFVLTFGTDSSLTIRPGWDEVTGLGTPNGANFVEEAAGR